MSVAVILDRLSNAGWSVTAKDGRLRLEPTRTDVPDLTDEQRSFLTKHKVAILQTLATSPPPTLADIPETTGDTRSNFITSEGSNVESNEETKFAATVEAWTPSGKRLVVTDQSPEHAILQALQEPLPADRRCGQCVHFSLSSYEPPLGGCSMHERIQHTNSRPTRFGCDEFQFDHE